MQIFVKLLEGNTCTLAVSASDAVASIKSMLHAKSGEWYSFEQLPDCLKQD